MATSSNECMGEDIVAYGNSKSGSIDGGCPEVYASKHARVSYFLESG